MKFDCGPTPLERLEQHERELRAEAKRIQQWHKVFAFLPVRIGSGDCRWFETVEVRYPDAFVSTYFGLEIHPGKAEYRALNG